ncbi:MAG: KH domain-containing protein [Anaerolineae bacterium]
MSPYGNRSGGRGAPRGRDTRYGRDARPPRDSRSAKVDPETVETARRLVEYVARNLVDHADQVSVKQVSMGSSGAVLELSVAPDDMGRIIGKQGRVANAIRTMLRGVARPGTRINLEIV